MQKKSLIALDYILEALSLLSVLGIVAWFVIFWIKAPQIIPIHFNIWGEVDQFGNKTTLIFLPILCILTYVGLTILNRFPHIFNYPTVVTEQNRLTLYRISTRALRWVKLFTCLLFTNTLWQLEAASRGHHSSNVLLFILIICLTGCLIFYITKMIKAGKKISQTGV